MRLWGCMLGRRVHAAYPRPPPPDQHHPTACCWDSTHTLTHPPFCCCSNHHCSTKCCTAWCVCSGPPWPRALACRHTAARWPVNLYLLGAFTVVEAFLVGMITSFFDTRVGVGGRGEIGWVGWLGGQAERSTYHLLCYWGQGHVHHGGCAHNAVTAARHNNLLGEENPICFQ